MSYQVHQSECEGQRVKFKVIQMNLRLLQNRQVNVQGRLMQAACIVLPSSQLPYRSIATADDLYVAPVNQLASRPMLLSMPVLEIT